MNSQNPSFSCKRRRWFSYSLRTFLIVLTVVCIWLGIKVDQARRQKQAVDTLRAFGAGIWYEHQRTKNGGFDGRIELDVPAWARELCGDDFFQTVTAVYIRRRVGKDGKWTMPRAITDENLNCLADLPQLERLEIENAPITDAGMAHLRHPERLRGIWLDDTNVGDVFIRRLKGAKRLEALWLRNTKVTDAGLIELSGITTLKRLSLIGTRTGDQGLAAFRACRQIEVLTLGRDVTNDGLRQFETLENLESLTANDQITGEAFLGFRLSKADDVSLADSSVSDDNLPPLVQAVRGVRILTLNGCAITDGGLQHLKHLGKTQILFLSKTQIQGRELRHLASLSGIVALILEGCPLDDPDLKSLEPLYTGTAPGGNLTLDKTPITDDDLTKISGFTNLLYLGLSQTNVSDTGMPHLSKLTKLLRIDLRGTRVTADGVKQVKQAIRGLKVAWDEDLQPDGWR